MGDLVALLVPISLKNAVQLIAVVCNQPYINSSKLNTIINSKWSTSVKNGPTRLGPTG